MTVQDFIVNYNQTFIYLHERFGKESVIELWKKLSVEFCVKLDELVQEKGLQGYYEFFYGSDGTASKEHVTGEAFLDPKGEFYERVDKCPSIQTLIDRKKKIYRYYCEHCYWLYLYSLEKNGFSYEADYSLQEEGNPINHCIFRAKKVIDRER